MALLAAATIGCGKDEPKLNNSDILKQKMPAN